MIWFVVGLVLGIAIGGLRHKSNIPANAEKLTTKETRLAYLYLRLAEVEAEMAGVWRASVPVMNEGMQSVVMGLFGEKQGLLNELRDAHADFAVFYDALRKEME